MVITKTYKTETAHIVRNAYSTRCRYNVHGHSYKWVIHIEGNVNKTTGMVIDFGNLKPLKDFVDNFDHSMILWSEEDPRFIDFFRENVKRLIVMKKNTTAENMASLLYNFGNTWLENNYVGIKIVKVEVWETETGRAIADSSDSEDVIVYEQIEG